jgi:hypothetical protein
MAGLGAEERHRQLGTGGEPAHSTAGAVDAARRVDRHQAAGGAQHVGDVGRDVAREPAAEQRVDHQVRA